MISMWVVVKEGYDGEYTYFTPLSVWCTEVGAKEEADRKQKQHPLTTWTHYDIKEVDFEPKE